MAPGADYRDGPSQMICEPFGGPPASQSRMTVQQPRVAHEFRLVPNVGHDTMALFATFNESDWRFYRGR